MGGVAGGAIGRRQFVAGAGAVAGCLGFPARLRSEPDRADVVIVGGGLAGLNAALILSDLGASVLVLEAAGYAGGRCRTRDRWNHSPDVGASQVGSTYARVLDTCRRFGVALAPGAHMNAPYVPVIGGTMIPTGAWASSPLNRTVGDEREILPHALFGHYVGSRTPLEDPSAWLSPEAAGLDISIAEWLDRQGASAEAVRLMFEANGRRPLGELSVLRMFQEATRARVEMKQVPPAQRRVLDHYEIASIISSHIVGGTSRLTDAMAHHLGDRLRLHSPVRAITQSSGGCEVTLDHGPTLKADYVVAALPFSTLRRIRLEPALSGAQAEAVASMPYNNQSQAWMEVKAPYWEADGLDGSLWTDGPLQYVRLQIEPDGSREVMSAIASGEKGHFLDSMEPSARGQFVLDEIARIRPSTRGKLEVIGVHSWTEGPGAGGCSFELPVGAVHSWIPAMEQPHGRLFFAGEHLRRLEVGMEAAMESGERAALAIAERSLA